jgi:hypothetical protein
LPEPAAGGQGEGVNSERSAAGGWTRRLPVLRRRQERLQRAMERQDDVVQSLVVATYALELGDVDKAKAAVASALEQSRTLLSELAERSEPRGLTRRQAAPS